MLKGSVGQDLVRLGFNYRDAVFFRSPLPQID